LRSIHSNRRLISSLLIANGIGLLVSCGGVTQSGSNPSSSLAPSASTLSFGNVQKSKSSSLSDSLTNTGTTSVTISDVTINGSGFSISGLTLPMTLSSRQSVTFTVTFTPAAAGSASGTLTVVSTAASTVKIALSGAEMAQGQLSIAPGNLSFGNVVVGASAALNGTLSASGSSVTISAAGTNSSEFILSGISLPTTLADGQSASFAITFTPAAAGAASAKLSVSSDAGNSPAAETLSGTGENAASHKVDLTWEASTGPDVVGYNVYRGNASGGPYSKINSALEASLAYTDTNVAAGQTYFYVTTAVNGSGDESAYSNQARAAVPNP
jgi:hypothetical protein